MNQRALVFSQHNAFQRTALGDIEHLYRQLLVAAQRECRGVHDLQLTIQRLVERDRRVPRRIRILFGIGRVNAIDLGRLQNDLGTDFRSAQAAAVSVVKNGLPVPAAKITTLPSSR